MERNTRRIINHSTNINLASSGARDSGEDTSIIGTQNNNNNGYSINNTAGDHPTTTSTTIVNSSSTTSAAGNHSNDIVIVPHENDILLGRGGNNNKHSGNNQLRVLARDLVLQYVNSSKKGKSHLSRLLVRQVRQMKPPGRFLKQHRLTREWADVGDKVAREKASQVLRDAIMLFANKNMKNKKKMHTSTATTTATATSTSWSDEKDHHATGLKQEDNLWKENNRKKSCQESKVTSSTSSSIATSCKSSMMMVSTNCSSPGSKYDLAPSTTTNQSSTRPGFPKTSGVSSRRTTTGASPSLPYYDSLCSHDNLFPWVLCSGNTTATTSSNTTTYHLPAPLRRIVTPSSSRDRYYYNQEIITGTTLSSFSNSSPKLNTFSYDASHSQDQHDEAQQQEKGNNNNNITRSNDDDEDADDISIILYHQQQQQSLNHKHQGTGDYHHMDLSQFDYPIFDHWDSMSFFDI